MKIVLQKDGKTGINYSYFVIGMMLFVALSVSFASFGKTRHNDHTSVFVDNSLKLFPKVKETQGVYQLFSHGRPGELLINGEWKNVEKIADFLIRNEELGIRTGLASQLGIRYKTPPQRRPLTTHNSQLTTHLNIYGCNFAQGAKGLAAVAYLEKTLGISVAASDDVTGRDGDWTLEVGQPVGVIAVASYDGNLQSSPPMNLNQTSNYSFCQRLGFTSSCYGNLIRSGNDVAVNSSGIIAVDGLFTKYNYLNANGTVTAYPAPTYAFLNSDFTYNASWMPAYSVALDDSTLSGCTLAQNKTYMTVTYDNCFIYQGVGPGLSPKIYKVCAGGVRTLLYSSSSTQPVALYASKLGDYFFIDERTTINGPYVIKKVSTLTGAVDATFTYSSPTLGSSQILEAPNGTVYIIENGTLKRLTATGTVDATFTTHTGVSAIGLQSTGKIIAGGVFTSPGITRYNTDGSVDPTFNKITDFYVTRTTTGGTARHIRVNSTDEIYVAGTFNEVNGYACGGIVKLSATGVVDDAFRLNTKGGLYQGSGVLDMELQSDGKLLLALHGQQLGFGNLMQTGLVRILPNGKVDTPINNTATNLDAKVPTSNDLLLCLGSIGGGYTSPIIGYNLSDYANFNQPGYNANPSLNGDTTAVNAFGQSQLEYSLVNQYYYMASTTNCVAYTTTDYSNSGKQDIAWAITLPPATASNANQIWDMNVSPDGKYLAVTQGIYNLCVLNAKTGAVVTANIPAAASGFISASYQPIAPYNLMVMAYSGAGGNQPVTLYRRTATGATINAITLQGTPNSGQITQSKMKWYSPVDFYYYFSGRFIYKYKLVTSATNLTPNVNGTYAKLDSAFSINGKMDNWLTSTSNPTQQTNPQYDGATVGPDGTLYTTADYFSCTGGTGINIVKIAPVGNNVDYRFIQSTSVPNSNTNNWGWITMALGQTGTCSTVPAVTPTGAANVCPATTVNLGTLATTSTLPFGTTLVWSTNKVPTGSSDTLTNLNVSTAGKYYALYYDKTYNCFGPADSLTVTITSPCPVVCSDPTKMAANCDFDGDGINNDVDLDDDNDGILDLYEMSCPPVSPTLVSFSGLPNGELSNQLSATYGVTFSSLSGYPAVWMQSVPSWAGSAGLGGYPSTGGATNWSGIKMVFSPLASSVSITGDASITSTNQIYFKVYDINGNLLYQDQHIDNGGTFSYTSSSNNIARVEVYNNTPTSGESTAFYGLYIGRINLSTCTDLDTDNDGIPNRLDTDSDNDGCTDAFETGTSTTNVATVLGPYGANGFADSKETSPESGVYNGSYTSYSNATDKNIHTCAICGAGTTAMTLSATTKTNVCPIAMADLTGLVSSTCPGTSTLQWHNTNTSLNQTTTLVTNSTAVPAGTYYPVCYDAAMSCYSPTPATGVTVTIVDCCAAGTVAPVIQKN